MSGETEETGKKAEEQPETGDQAQKAPSTPTEVHHHHIVVQNIAGDNIKIKDSVLQRSVIGSTSLQSDTRETGAKAGEPGPTSQDSKTSRDDDIPKRSSFSETWDAFERKEAGVIFAKGMLMGSADIVPGVSGGTMALITGIYERLIHAIKGVDLMFIPHFLKGDTQKAKENFWSMDFPFIIPLALGVLVAVLTLAQVILFAMEEQRAVVFAFFFGLILSSAHIVYKYIEKIDWQCVVSAIVGLVFVVVIIGLDEISENHSLPMLFFSGMLAICAMILPGISGSLILVIIGQYEYMIEALKGFSVVEIIVFVTGAALGLAAFSRLLDYLLKNHHALTMSFLFGLMLGALRKPMEEVGAGIDGNFQSLTFAAAILAAIIGFAAVFYVEKLAAKTEAVKEGGGKKGSEVES